MAKTKTENSPPISLKQEFNLPDNVHAHGVLHGLKDYNCENCFTDIPYGKSSITLTLEPQSASNYAYQNVRLCSKKCLQEYLKGKLII